MPWLMKEVKKEMGNMIESRELLMGKIKLKVNSLLRNVRNCIFSNFIFKNSVQNRKKIYLYIIAFDRQ